MNIVGLTGGIGSGKSTVAQLLVERGAVLVDADAIVRELQEPGQPVLAAMVEAFGDGILDVDGRLDRQAVAGRVFGDAEALAALNGIVHPAVRGEIVRRTLAAAETGAEVLVLDIPLVTVPGRDGVQALLVVDTPVEVAVERLVSQRGMAEADARARIAAQISRAERVAIADRVIDNSGDHEALVAQVDAAWDWMRTLEVPPPPPGEPPVGEPPT